MKTAPLFIALRRSLAGVVGPSRAGREETILFYAALVRVGIIAKALPTSACPRAPVETFAKDSALPLARTR
jgi:hypothetical protein